MFLLPIGISRAIRSTLAEVTLEDASRRIVMAINQLLSLSLSLSLVSSRLVCIQAVSNEREHVAEIAKQKETNRSCAFCSFGCIYSPVTQYGE